MPENPEMREWQAVNILLDIDGFFMEAHYPSIPQNHSPRMDSTVQGGSAGY
jgi:hypothetical protein